MSFQIGKTKVLSNYIRVKRRCGFKSKNQLPLFMIWDEEWYHGEVVYAYIVFNSADWIGI